MSSAQTEKPRFLADKMLGRLAKWLRILGYDTKYAFDLSDSDLLELAESENRILLTRDTLLTQRKKCRNYVFITSDHWREQLKQVYNEARLNKESLLTICPVCNTSLNPVDKQSVEPSVPPYVYRTQEQFYRCGGCSRIFWPATHVSRILDEIDKLKETP
ncbi:MAG: Mut7-C RNAse domain-containing protein [Candidatus Abyssubacteria bacterium]